MRIFVAGGAGVIGRRLVPMLVAAGHEVTATTRRASRAAEIEAMDAQVAVCDAFDADGLREAVVAARPEVVVHQLTDLPAAIDPRRVERQFAGNDRIRVEGTRNLVAAAQAAGASAIVAQSIAFAYAPGEAGGSGGERLKDEDAPLALDASGPWGRSVAAVQSLERQVLGAEGLRGVALRYGYFYGPGSVFDPKVGSTAAMVRRRRFPIVGGGRGTFSFVHVDDAAGAAVVAAERDDVAGAFNVVDDEPATLAEWLPPYARALGAKPPRRVPAWLARLVAGEFGVAFATRGLGATNARAKRELGWSPAHPTWRETDLTASER